MVRVVVIPVVVFLVGVAINRKSPAGWDMEIGSAYECGFRRYGAQRRPFSLYFFQLALLFLVFDAEVLILMPIPVLSFLGGVGVVGMGVFLVCLVGGLYHE